MKKLFLPYVLLALAAIILTACGSNTAQPAPISNTSQTPGLIAEGRLMPLKSMDQSFTIPGQIAEILVKDGDHVEAGQVLARLSVGPEAQAALARARQEALSAQQALDKLASSAGVNLTQGQLAVIAAQEQLKAAQDQYDAENTLENEAKVKAAKAFLKQAEDDQKKLEAGAGEDPDQKSAAEARLASANAAAASAQAALNAHELKASMAGTVVDLTLQVGEWVAAGQPVINVADFSSWVVKTDNLTENEVVNIEVGQKAEINLDALPEVTLNGEVTHVNMRYEEKRGDITYTVTLVLNQVAPAIRWGMTAAVQFVP